MFLIAPSKICQTSPAGFEPATFGFGGRSTAYIWATPDRHLAFFGCNCRLHLADMSRTPECRLANRPNLDPAPSVLSHACATVGFRCRSQWPGRGLGATSGQPDPNGNRTPFLLAQSPAVERNPVVVTCWTRTLLDAPEQLRTHLAQADNFRDRSRTCGTESQRVLNGKNRRERKRIRIAPENSRKRG